MRVLVVYHSVYGNTFKMARAVAAGARAVSGVEVTVARIADQISAGSYEKDERVKNAQILQKEIPPARVDELPSYRAVILGSPSRYGMLSAPVRHFLDQTAALWAKGAMEGKFAGVFTCSATAYGAGDSALLSLIVPLLHLGMIVAGMPHSANALFPARAAISPYGVSALVGQNCDQPPDEAALRLSQLLGQRIAGLSRMPLREKAAATAER